MGRDSGRIARNGYRAITATLRSEIESGEIKVGNYLPTERELQDRFGASRTTIRKVLFDLADEGWARNIPKKGFVAGRGYRFPTTNQIAFIEDGSNVVRSIGDYLHSRCIAIGYELVRFGGSISHPMEQSIQEAIERHFAGAIVWPYLGFPDQDIVTRAPRQIPIVALDHRVPGADTDVVTFDHERVAYDATEHLIQQGARQIGVTGMLDMLDVTHLRFRGYMKALFANGLTPQAKNFQFTFTSGNEGAHEVEALEARLRAGNRPDALLILHDFCAPPVVEAALRAGLNLPSDLRLATLGDDWMVAVNDIEITCVAFDWISLANQALDLLIERLRDLHRSSIVRMSPHRLIVRGLSGAPQNQWTPEPERSELSLAGAREIHRYQTRWISH